MTTAQSLSRRGVAAVRESWRVLVARVAGDEVTRPIAETSAFAVLYGAYGCVLLASLVAVAGASPVRGSLPTGVEGIQAWTLPALFLGLAGWARAVARVEALSAGVPWVNLRALGPGVAYVGVANLGAVGFSPAFLGATLLHAVVLAFLFEVYSHPLVPGDDRSDAALRLHLTNWWRVSQIAVSGAIALGIGLVAQFYLTVQRSASIQFFLAFTGPLAAGFGFHVLYLLWKMDAVETRVGG